MTKKFQVIVADPAWDFGDSLRMSSVPRGAKANYNTMTISQIKDLPVKGIADPDGAFLALWVPSSLLQEGLDVLSAWGFQHKQTYIWVKTKKNTTLIRDMRKSFVELVKKVGRKALRLDGKPITYKDFDFVMDSSLLAFGMGRLFRQAHEICLIGINNNKIYKKLANKSQRSVSFGENLKHSAKPEHLQNSLEEMFPGTDKIELFARRVRPGWVCLGNEVCSGEDIAVSIAKL